MSNHSDSPSGRGPRGPRGPAPVRQGSGPARFGIDLVLGLLLQAAVAMATWWALGLPASYPAVVLALYGVLALTLVVLVPSDLPGPGMGWANRVTLARGTLVLPVATFAVWSLMGGTIPSNALWWIVVFSGLAMVFDSLDGRIARRTGTSTTYGARFDMELDAFLLLVLSVLAWREAALPVWVLAIGGLRYVFVAAGWIVPALRGDLPESQRRKTVCVAAGLALLVALGPVVPRAVAVPVAAAGLALLGYSFAVDVIWLVRAGPRGPVRTGTGGSP